MLNRFFLFKKKEVFNSPFFKVTFHQDMIFGVTAANASEAEAMICEEIFHNQTIPGFPQIKQLNLEEVKNQFPDIDLAKIKQKGIWYP